MIVFLLLIPLFVVGSAIGMYQLNGKKEILRFDIVQFFYAFILAPLLFLWSKSILFLILSTEVAMQLTQEQIFLYDTLYSVLALYLFAFIVMHSLTKSFNLKVGSDPFHDIFQHSEYFHLWLSHLAIFIGSALLFSILGLVNSVFPIDVALEQHLLYVFIFSGVIAGLVIFVGILLSNPKQKQVSFTKLLKIVYGGIFTAHVLVYFLFYPELSIQFMLYWTSTALFATFVLCSLFSYKSEKAQTLFEQIADKFKHNRWDTRVQLFNRKIKK